MQLAHPHWLDPGALEAIDPGNAAAAMVVAVGLARENVARGTGGPFGAVVIAGDGRVVGAGVNVVLAQASSLAHADTTPSAGRRLRKLRFPDHQGAR